jgi:hypothetical protein
MSKYSIGVNYVCPAFIAPPGSGGTLNPAHHASYSRGLVRAFWEIKLTIPASPRDKELDN